MAAGDYNAAVLAAMRTIAQTASDRTLLLGARSPPPTTSCGGCAHLPPTTRRCTAADVFDAVAYGGRRAGSGTSAAALVAPTWELSEAKPTGFVDGEIAEMSLLLLPPVSR